MQLTGTGWGDISVVKVLAMLALGSEFGFSECTETLCGYDSLRRISASEVRDKGSPRQAG